MKIIKEILYMPEALEFIDSLEPKARNKVLYNLSKAQEIQNQELFKKLDGEIWEFRTLYNSMSYRCCRDLFAWVDKESTENATGRNRESREIEKRIF